MLQYTVYSVPQNNVRSNYNRFVVDYLSIQVFAVCSPDSQLFMSQDIKENYKVMCMCIYIKKLLTLNPFTMDGMIYMPCHISG